MAVDPFRFLGLAFATADLLFEVDETGRVTFAAGAGQKLAGVDAAGLTGRSWLELVADADRPTAEALLAGLADGERRGLAEIELASGAPGPVLTASLSAFRLPQNAPRLSCALTLIDGGRRRRRPKGKLFDRAEFESIARALVDGARDSGPELELGLIELAGLDRQKQGLSADDANALDRRLAGALKAESYADAAAELGDQRYAVVRRRGDTAEAMVRRLTQLLGPALEPSAQALPIEGARSLSQLMRAVKLTLDGFIADGAPPAGASLSEALNASVRKAVADANAFGAVVDARQFKLVFQPVVSLSTGEVRHYETLVRFEEGQSPFAMIRMAEELDVIEDLDRAVAEEAFKRLRADRFEALKLAVNVSGRSIVSSGFVDSLLTMEPSPWVRKRLILEITESAAISDLALAQRHIEALQAAGYQVCLDDFGAGAASFAYLRALKVDIVKIDGSYVRELAAAGRDDTMVRHLVNLCHELKVETVAEMVETKQVEDILHRAGVDYAQGWLYGQPAAEPKPPAKAVTAPRSRSIVRAAVRRDGAKEQWG
jgi:EAL domain-containing protein (putative c-di-GMP-specific phosphodiesterase class I)